MDYANNLRTIMNYFDVTNNMLAKALAVDPSLVSRWLKRQRQLTASSETMDKLCNYLLSKSNSLDDMDWLKRQFERAGLSTELVSVSAIKQNLIIWLASDGENLIHSFGKAAKTGLIDNVHEESSMSTLSDFNMCTGFLSLALYLDELLSSIPEKQKLDIHLSREDMETITHSAVCDVLLRHIESKNLQIRLLISLSNNTNAMSKLINLYMPAIIKGNLVIGVTHGMTQAVSNQMNIICCGECVVQITETAKAAVPPIALIIKDSLFVKDVQKSFDSSMNYSQPLLQIFTDNYSRNILEIIFMEFCSPGALDVIKDSLNPMYMSLEAYDRVLKSMGHKGEQFKWRSAEFVRFKAGFDANYEAGTQFREIVPLSRLNKIIKLGYCRQPALYFMYKSVMQLDTQGCIETLKGYLKYLKKYPNFNLVIVDDAPQLNADCCWRLKQNHHIAMNYWVDDEAFFIYSDQLMLTYEFQAHFNNIWLKSGYSAGGRANTIAILNDVIGKLEEKLK